MDGSYTVVNVSRNGGDQTGDGRSMSTLIGLVAGLRFGAKIYRRLHHSEGLRLGLRMYGRLRRSESRGKAVRLAREILRDEKVSASDWHALGVAIGVIRGGCEWPVEDEKPRRGRFRAMLRRGRR